MEFKKELKKSDLKTTNSGKTPTLMGVKFAQLGSLSGYTKKLNIKK